MITVFLPSAALAALTATGAVADAATAARRRGCQPRGKAAIVSLTLEQG